VGRAPSDRRRVPHRLRGSRRRAQAPPELMYELVPSQMWAPPLRVVLARVRVAVLGRTRMAR